MFAQVVKVRIAIVLFVGLIALPSLLFGDEGNDLAISNPFYQPYAGDFFVATDISYQTLKIGIDFLGLNIQQNEMVTYNTLRVKYAFDDRFVAGATADYLMQDKITQTYSGTTFNPPNTSLTNSGFVQPSVFVVTRLLGTQREEWYLDVQGSFRVGNKDSANFQAFYPNNQIDVKIGLGRNSGDLTYGISAVTQYWQFSSTDSSNEKNDKVLTLTQFFLQYDFSPLYVRGNAGVIKYLDQRSLDNPIQKLTRAAFSAELGCVISDSLLFSANASLIPAASGTGTFLVFPNSSFNVSDFWILSASVAAKF